MRLNILTPSGRKQNTYTGYVVQPFYSLAVYAKELNYKGLQIKGAFTIAEQLPIEQAAFISEVFKREVKGLDAEVNCLGFQTKMGGKFM